MNIHHLELFYYVAKHGGISSAVRQMPYGIQQPAVSAQILRLEEDLETVLFQRRPFRLTKAGEKLFSFIAPFFTQLDEVAAQIRGTVSQRLRLGASGPVLRNYVPAILTTLRRRYPKLRLSLRETNQLEAETLLRENEIDLAISELEGKSPPGIKTRVIVRLPLALMVARDSSWRSAEQFLRAEPLQESLVALPGQETLTRLFQQGFAQRGLDLVVGLEVSSLESMKTYVAGGFGSASRFSLPRQRQMRPLDYCRCRNSPSLSSARSGRASSLQLRNRFWTRWRSAPHFWRIRCPAAFDSQSVLDLAQL